MKKMFDKFGKKKIYATGIVASLVTAIVFTIFALPKGIEVELVKETQMIELGVNPFDVELKDVFKDYDKLLKDSKIGKVVGELENSEGKKILVGEITKENFLPVGTYKMKYSVDVKEKKAKTFVVTYKVEDTTKPTFEDFNEVIEVEEGSAFDLLSMFKATDLSEVVVTLEKDGKGIEQFSPTEIGEHKMTVVATDKYKNKSSKEVTIKVIAKKELVEATPDNNANAGVGNSGNTSTGGNANSGAGSNGGSSGSGGGTTPPPNVCVPNGQFGRVGNSGKVFYSKAEADGWAETYILNQGDVWTYTGWYAWTVYDNCGERNDIWTVDFY